MPSGTAFRHRGHINGTDPGACCALVRRLLHQLCDAVRGGSRWRSHCAEATALLENNAVGEATTCLSES
eukprot:4765390-Pyramimonas_sp.AAC.1